MGKAELSALLRQCVSAMSNRFPSESICDPLYGNGISHREAWPLGVSSHTWTDLESPHPPPHKDSEHKDHPEFKVPTSILRRRPNLIGSSTALAHSPKSGRKVHFRDPEFTVHTYCAPARPRLPFPPWPVLLFSVLLVMLFCTSWTLCTLRPSKILQALMGKLVWGSWLWLTMQ